MRDTVYSQQRQTVEPFAFNSEVAGAFDDMISRSVPLYHEMQDFVVSTAQRILKPGDTVIDLGCSTGTSLFRLATDPRLPRLHLIGFDQSQEMLEQAEAKQELFRSKGTLISEVEFRTANVVEAVLEPSTLILLNYTAQFIEPDLRLDLLRRCKNALLPGGELIFSEKLRFEEPALHAFMIDTYHNFKRANGYSDLEIEQKRKALEDVLRPNTLEENLGLLESSGFQNSTVIMQWCNFCTMLAR